MSVHLDICKLTRAVLNRFARKSVKILLWIVGIIIGLVLLVFLLIQVPYVQNIGKNRVVSFLQEKLKTDVAIGRLSFDFPKRLVLEDVYFADQKGDTLFAGDTLKVELAFLKLLTNQVIIHEIDLRGITAHINRNTVDSIFNYEYAINAFKREEEREARIDSSVMKFSVNKINLDRINFKLDDEVTGNAGYIFLKHFDTNIKDFDLDSQKFNVPKITLTGLHAKLRQTKALSQETITTDTMNIKPAFTYPDVSLGELDFSDIHIDYGNTVTAIDSKVDLDSLHISFDNLDLPNQQVDVSKLKLINTSGSIALGKTAQEAVESTATEVATIVKKGWVIQLDKFDLENIDFKYDDLEKREASRGIDYSHLDLQDIYTEAEDVNYSIDAISGNVSQLSLKESSGLDLRKFQAEFFYGNHSAHLNNLLIETPGTIIKDRIQLTYPSIDTLSKDISVIGINANFIDNEIAVKDILLFAPALARKEPFKSNQNETILLDGAVNGRVSDVTISNLDISGLGQFVFKGSGNIKGLPDFNTAYFDLDIDKLSATDNDIVGIVPRGSIPSSIRLPEYITMNGRFKGTLKSFNTNMNINSSYGAVVINGTLKNITVSGKEVYNANIKTTNFNIGRFLRQEEKLGKITMAGHLKGAGTDPKSADISFDGKIIEVDYNGYNYRNLVLDGSTDNGDIKVVASMNDPNITFDVDGYLNRNGKYPTAKLTLNIDTLNLKNLNLYEKDFWYHGTIIADLPTADPDYLNGTIDIANSIIVTPETRYRLDTIKIVSVATEGEDSLDLRSEFMTLHLAGNYNLTKIVPAVQDHIDKYFDTTPAGDITTPYPPQRFEFTAQIFRSPIVEQLLPDLKELEDARLTGNFDSEKNEFLIDGSIPRLRYKELVVLYLGLDVKTENDAINYSLAFEEFSNKKIQVVNTSLSGQAKNDKLDIKLQINDSDDKEQYRIAGDLVSSNSIFEYKLLIDGLILNYERWNVSENNGIQFGKEGIMMRNFKISNAEQSLTINSDPQKLGSPMDIQFDDFRIETITRIISKDSLLAGGVVNGHARIRDLKSNFVFNSDLTVQDFSFHGDTVGNIAIKVNNETPGTYKANVTITGYDNHVILDGYYTDSGDKSIYNLDANIVRWNLKSIEGFTGGELDDGSGYVTGNLKITGSSLTPNIRGDITFRDAGFRLTRFNSYYRANNETLSFTDDGLHFNTFMLVDSAGNEAIVDGTIFTSDYKDYRFDLEVLADNFQVMNSTRDNNKLYYGRLFIDTDLHIHGAIDHPVVDGTLTVKENTSLTVVIPQTDPGIVEREGIVEFVDMDTIEINTYSVNIDTMIKSELRGLDVVVSIIIDRKAELNLIIDETNGDYLRVKGMANLTGGIDPSGKVALSGTYELDEGAYSFSFNQLKREFLISKGSTITWKGDPMTADVNVTAVYTAETAPLSLVENQLADAEQNVINTYKQKLPFQILLTMTGELLKPIVTFDIELPEKNYGVSTEIVSTVNARLAQLRTEPSELNKQVFAVLLLNRFISDDPFQNSARGAGVSTLARQSASKLLSEQLNNVLGGMIVGMDLSFDINSIEDYTTGELQNRTDLTVGLSKRLLDDRLNISIGSQFELEGPKETDRKATNIAGDVSVEYQLSKDGRYLIRAYRKNEYIVLQGQVVETGVGFVFTADYDQFKDMFAKKTEEQKTHLQQAREARKAARKEEKKNE